MSDLCTVCGEALDDGRLVQRDLDGGGAHADCLKTPEPEGDDE